MVAGVRAAWQRVGAHRDHVSLATKFGNLALMALALDLSGCLDN